MLEAAVESMLFKITPNIENTTENPRTKNIVFIKTLSLLVARLMVPLFLCSSVIVVPDMYAINAGITGSMHGARKDPRPAKAAIAMVSSCMASDLRHFIKVLFQISSKTLDYFVLKESIILSPSLRM